MKSWAIVFGLFTQYSLLLAWAGAAEPLPLPLVWRVGLLSVAQEETVADLERGFANENVAAIPQFRNAVGGDVILMRSFTGICAVDFSSGKRVWEYPWGPVGSDFPRPAADDRLTRLEVESRLWHEATFATLTVDGDHVIFLESPTPVFPFAPGRRIIVVGGRTQEDPSDQSSSLMAMSLRSQGKFIWRTGKEHDDKEFEFDGYSFLGTGVVAGNQLFAVALVKNTLQVAAIDVAKGKLLWNTELVKLAEDASFLTRPSWRRPAIMPLVIGKTVLCLTGQGRIVAVNSKTHDIDWTLTYPTSEDIERERFPTQQLPPLPTRWLDNALLAAGDLVIATPNDSSVLIGLDPASGKEKWRVERGSDLYAAANDEACLLIGPGQVRALRVADGTPLWEKSWKLPAGALVSGRGVFDGDHYLLPDSKGNLHRLAWRTGESQLIAHFEKPLGNLMLHQGSLLSQTSIHLSCFRYKKPLK